MSLSEKFWWAICIRANRYRYNYGRQANRTLADLILPDVIPAWVSAAVVPDLGYAVRPARPNTKVELDITSWQPFRFKDLFELHRGRRILRRDVQPGSTPYIRATAFNNGINSRVDLPPDFPAGLITVSSNGSVAEAFYQDEPFIASDDIVVLIPKFHMTPAVALFLCSLIYAERYRFNYGRKWFTTRMSSSTLKLPVLESGSPDWQLAEDYMLSLPMSSVIEAPEA
jgi:hypothetical protein